MDQVMQSLKSIYTNIITAVTAEQMFLIAVLLLVVVIVLLIVMSAKERRFEAQLGAEAAKLEAERSAHNKKLSENEQALKDKETIHQADLAKRDAAHQAEKAELQSDYDELNDRATELQAFHDEYAIIPDARAEAERIVGAAKAQAYAISNHTDKEYLEIMQHVNDEAEAIRAMAQARLVRSHDSLKQAIMRANQIVEEAHAEAERIIQRGGNRLAEPAPTAQLEAPAEAEEPETPADAPQPEDIPVESDSEFEEESPFEDLDEIPEI